MPSLIQTFLSAPLARPAMIVPTLIMLVFSVFTLTAPMSPERLAPTITLGIVNQDEGLTMPPIKISERLLAGLSGQMPFQTRAFETPEAAEAALAAGAVSVVVGFPAEFSTKAFAGEQAAVNIVTSPAVTVAEAQLAGQLERMLPAAMSAGVASMKLAMASGQMPTGAMPVVATVTRLGTDEPAAAAQAPFVMLYTTWLAAFVGAIMMTLSTRARPDRGRVAVTRTVLPIAIMGVASLVLSIIVGATVGWSVLLPVWLAVWSTTLALTWFFVGLLSVLGLWMIAVILPLVFYQSAIGGVMMPAAAAPEWLTAITGWAGLDALGAAYRGVVHGIALPYPAMLIAIFAVIGLGLIWLRTQMPVRHPAPAPTTA
ncbi:hypothetical protein [uncultured Maritimibacter sp.]|jgi:ABC-2 type transport system permease protein|uniref:hypothetical protein n=1 Tax=uncultured Maritimibacter sp. TaxID=991866 RepID=UPI002620B274|nr:hypothetical protein [uncultured Maritimibacter sp.]